MKLNKKGEYKVPRNITMDEFTTLIAELVAGDLIRNSQSKKERKERK